MITIKAAFTDRDTTLGLLGRVGENGTRQIEFDCAEILAEYPEAVIVCAVRRPGETSAYAAELTAEGTNRILLLRSVEMAKSGVLKIELSALDGEDVRRSTVFTGGVASGLLGDEPDDATEDTLLRLEKAVLKAEEALAEAKKLLDGAGDVKPQVQADWNQNDPTATDYVKNRPMYVEEVKTYKELDSFTPTSDWAYTGFSINAWPVDGVDMQVEGEETKYHLDYSFSEGYTYYECAEPQIKMSQFATDDAANYTCDTALYGKKLTFYGNETAKVYHELNATLGGSSYVKRELDDLLKKFQMLTYRTNISELNYSDATDGLILANRSAGGSGFYKISIGADEKLQVNKIK